jgi:hypothetical protein
MKNQFHGDETELIFFLSDRSHANLCAVIFAQLSPFALLSPRILIIFVSFAIASRWVGVSTALMLSWPLDNRRPCVGAPDSDLSVGTVFELGESFLLERQDDPTPQKPIATNSNSRHKLCQPRRLGRVAACGD